MGTGEWSFLQMLTKFVAKKTMVLMLPEAAKAELEADLQRSAESRDKMRQKGYGPTPMKNT